jgi:hypothetical protein
LRDDFWFIFHAGPVPRWRFRQMKTLKLLILSWIAAFTASEPSDSYLFQ